MQTIGCSWLQLRVALTFSVGWCAASACPVSMQSTGGCEATSKVLLTLSDTSVPFCDRWSLRMHMTACGFELVSNVGDTSKDSTGPCAVPLSGIICLFNAKEPAEPPLPPAEEPPPAVRARASLFSRLD